ncbi:MAG: hypothetical protein RG741_00965 [Bacteroidales bacterium]|nr:hypothetical protein [Bacteroidales bacterium]
MVFKTRIQRSALAALVLAVVFLINDGKPASSQQRWWQRSSGKEVRWDSLYADYDATGKAFQVIFHRGKAHNHPLMAVWMEDTAGNYLQTIYVAESIGRGVFLHGDPSTGKWLPGPIRRPAALPYWGHQRGIQADDGLFLPTQDDPMPDGITGPTPKASFVIFARIPDKHIRTFRVLFEINQSWDWNEYWTNNKFPYDQEYMTSSQPALVYETWIDLDRKKSEYVLQPIGHSHWSGKTGDLFDDLSTITTALDISEKVIIRFPEE